MAAHWAIRTDAGEFADTWLYGGWIFATLYGWERQWQFRTFEFRTDYAAHPAAREPFFQKEGS